MEIRRMSEADVFDVAAIEAKVFSPVSYTHLWRGRENTDSKSRSAGRTDYSVFTEKGNNQR